MAPECRFSSTNIRAEHSYPPRFKTCKGEVTPFNDCKGPAVAKQSERSAILVRTGHIRYHFMNRWYICEEHRKKFGGGFEREIVQRQKKCIFPDCNREFSTSRHRVTYEHAMAYIERENRIIPFDAKVCTTCYVEKLVNYLKEHKEEKAAAQRRESNELVAVQEAEQAVVEARKAEKAAARAREEVEQMAVEAIENEDVAMEEAGDIGSEYEPSPSGSGAVLDTEVPSSQDQPTPKESKVTDLLVSLIQTVDSKFNKEKCMRKSKTPILKMKRATQFKLKNTGAKAIDAIISAMTIFPSDKRLIWKILKESGCVERQLGLKDFLDSHLREIIKSHNMAQSSAERLECVSFAAKIPFRRLDQFNPDPKDNSNHPQEANEENQMEVEVDNGVEEANDENQMEVEVANGVETKSADETEDNPGAVAASLDSTKPGVYMFQYLFTMVEIIWP